MNGISTRRTFLKASALIAAPVAVPAAAVAAATGSDAETRLARREDEAAIRALHDAWLRRINAGDGALGDDVRGVAPDHRAGPDVIEVAEDGSRATGRFPCVVEVGTELPRDCTLGQMAHAQGSGFVCHSEGRVLAVDYVKARDGWTIDKAVLAA